MIIEIYDMTVQLQSSLEDCIEMAEENRDDTNDETGDGKNYSCPNIGVCFLDLAEVITNHSNLNAYAYIHNNTDLSIHIIESLNGYLITI